MFKALLAITLLLSGVSQATTSADENYNYEGNDWLDTCKEGKKQSPINIPINIPRTHEERHAVKNNSELDLEIDYQNPTNLTVVNTGTTFKTAVSVGEISFWD